MFLIRRSVVAIALDLWALACLSPASAAESYCDGQRGICRTICGQVATPGTPKRLSCDTGCERSAMMCQSTGSFNFAPVEQFMPEFHRQ
ncbi:MAG: hypothetical protein P4L98_04560 [Ancalomicrobiaceae bacterium]|nr:hypothetical protein [Ancalomicrobiaceae bacterium]